MRFPARRRFNPVSLAAALTLVVSLGAFRVAHENLKQAIQFDFDSRAHLRVARIRRSIEDRLADLGLVQSLYSKVEGRAANLRELIEPTLRQLDGSQSFAWVARVRNSERVAFEAGRHEDGLAHFRIGDRLPDGRFVPSSERAEYFPIVPVNPIDLPAELVGFDLASDGPRGVAIRESRDFGELVATPRVPLLGEAGESTPGFVVSAPVYGGGAVPGTLGARQDLLRGVVLGVFRLSGIMEEELGLKDDSKIAATLLDLDAPLSKRVLLGGTPLEETPERSPDRMALGTRFVPNTMVTDFIVARRNWRLIISPSGDSSGDYPLGGAWIVFFSTLGVGGLLTGYLELARRSSMRRREFSAALRNSLSEKETLLQEVHHRVKNNLQVVSSLHTLQIGRLTDPHTRAVFEVARDRIDSMAMIHEQLYGSGDFARIGIAEFARTLGTKLANIYRGPSTRVIVDVEAEEIWLPLHLAAPFGLILNELITNALLHGFPDDRDGRILVSISETKEGEVEVVVADNGVGFAFGEKGDNGGLGLQLVKALTEQLAGTIRFVSDGGARVTLRFLASP